MATGGTVEELDAQVDALVGALVAHRAAVQDAEQRAVADPEHADMWASIAAVHHDIVHEYVTEIRMLRAEIGLIPRQRPPS